MDPDDLAKGVTFWKSEVRMDELCEFLAFYARQVHSKRYYRSALVANPGATYLDIITASDVAYAVSLIKNGRLVWIHQLCKDDDEEQDEEDCNKDEDEDEDKSEDENEDEAEEGDEKKTKKKTKTKTKTKVQALFTAGEGKKRTFGITTWNDEGKEFFESALENWKPAFTSKDIQNKILRRHWDKWLETEGRDMSIELDGIKGKTIYDVLRPREAGEVVRTKNKKRSEPEDDDEDYEYTSDAEEHAVDIGGWNQRRSMCDDSAYVHNGDDGGDDDDDDDDDEFLSSTSKEQDNNDFEETGRKKEGGGRKAPPVLEDIDSSDDSDKEEEGEEEERSTTLFQMEIEEEAQKAGLKNTKKRGGKKTVAKSTTTAATRPERKKRGKQTPVLRESPRRKSDRSNLGTKKARYE
jgi:hypothetical protein